MTAPPMPVAPSGALVEIYSAIQGEGPHVGRRQIFLRLAGCNLACPYCDQPEARITPPACAVERLPGSRRFTRLPNPVSVPSAAEAILDLHRRGPHHAVAVTGGEPLLQADFLAGLLPLLRRGKLPILLETNATRPDALRALLPCLDIVSIDFKLRSATGRRMPAVRHVQCLRLAVRRRVEVYVKAVVTEKTTVREITAAARLVRRVKRSVPFILQPVTPIGKRGPRPPAPLATLNLQQRAARLLDDVRVIPQTHKLTGQR